MPFLGVHFTPNATHWAMFPLVQQLRLPWGEKIIMASKELKS